MRQFDAAMAEVGRRTFAGGERFWADLVYAGHEFAWESANELVNIDQDKYHQVMTCEQRLANIDARRCRGGDADRRLRAEHRGSRPAARDRAWASSAGSRTTRRRRRTASRRRWS